MSTETTLLLSTYSFNTAEKQSWTVPEHPHKIEHAFKEKQGFQSEQIKAALLSHTSLSSWTWGYMFSRKTPVLNCELPLLISGRDSLDWDQDNVISLTHISSTAISIFHLYVPKAMSESNQPSGQVV